MDFSRFQVLIGEASFLRLKHQVILLFGLGGVGSFVAEALGRSGIEHLILVDHDVVQATDINRQLIALSSTVSHAKVEVMKARLLDINPQINVQAYPCKLTAENLDEFLALEPNFIVDAIDDVSAKLLLIQAASERNIPLISAMGFANKCHPELIQIGSLDTTSVCPLARTIRQSLKRAGSTANPTVVYSKEPPRKSQDATIQLASSAFVPPAAGLMMASVVIQYFMEESQ